MKRYEIKKIWGEPTKPGVWRRGDTEYCVYVSEGYDRYGVKINPEKDIAYFLESNKIYVVSKNNEIRELNFSDIYLLGFPEIFREKVGFSQKDIKVILKVYKDFIEMEVEKGMIRDPLIINKALYDIGAFLPKNLNHKYRLGIEKIDLKDIIDSHLKDIIDSL